MILKSVPFSVPNRLRTWGIAVLALFAATPAFAAPAASLGAMTNNIYFAFIPLQVFIGAIVFVLGLWYVYQGVQSLRATGEGGQNAPPMSKSLFKLGGGAALVSLPFIVTAVINTVTNDSSTLTELHSATPTFTDPGLDHALGRFVIDFFKPFMANALPYFCYIAGLIFVITGVQRLANGDGKGPTLPGGFGTFSIFVVGAGLLSLGYFMSVLQGSIFGVTDLYANATLKDHSSALSQRAESVIWAIFQFLRIAGYISVVRGLFMMKTYADGGQASLMGVSSHIIAGAMLANVWYFVWAVQNTFIGASNSAYFVFNAPPGL